MDVRRLGKVVPVGEFLIGITGQDQPGFAMMRLLPLRVHYSNV